jgi:hypothetical protein
VGSNVRSFLDTVLEAYETNPLEIALILGISALLLSALIAFSVFSAVKARREAIKRSQARYEEKLDELKLPPSHVDILERMAERLADDSKKHEILTRRNRFNRLAAKMVEDREVPPDAISALRIQLDFPEAGGESLPVSTTALPRGASLSLRANKRSVLRGVIAEKHADGLKLELRSEVRRLPAGLVLEAQYKSASGIFRFTTAVVYHDGSELLIRHSESLRRFQRRSFFRRTASLPVEVRAEGKPPRLHYTRDVGGGGAAIMTPERDLGEGDKIALRFILPAGAGKVEGTARVLRVSENGTLAHVRFEEIRERDRDRIFRAILAQPHSSGTADAGASSADDSSGPAGISAPETGGGPLADADPRGGVGRAGQSGEDSNLRE